MIGPMLKIQPNSLDHRLGVLHAPACLVEYGDFECPHSALAVPVIDRLKNDFGSNLCFVYRHFPLSNLHSHAELAALASEAVDLQGEFWAMHYLLF